MPQPRKAQFQPRKDPYVKPGSQSGKGGGGAPPAPPTINLGGGSGGSSSSSGSSSSGGSSGGSSSVPAAPPTPKEKAKALSEAEQQKLVGRLIELYKATHNGRPPPQKYIERLIRKNPRRLAKLVEGGELSQSEREEAIGDLVEIYEATHDGAPPSDNYIKQLLRAKPKKLEKLVAEGQIEAATQAELNQFIAGIINDYTDAYGIAVPEDLIRQLEGMDRDQLAAYNSKLQKVLEGKAKGQQAKDQYVAELSGVYWEAWGHPPPPGYVEKAAETGLNIYEFEDQEKAKPAWMKSRGFKNGLANLAAEMGDLFAGGG